MTLCKLAKNTFPIIGILLSFIIMFFMLRYYTNTHVMIEYDCRIAEISPDFPAQVRELCREANKEDDDEYNV